MMNSFSDIPQSFLSKWQNIVDILAKIIGIPSALIMKVENEHMEVFISSKSENNPYQVGQKELWNGLLLGVPVEFSKWRAFWDYLHTGPKREQILGRA